MELLESYSQGLLDAHQLHRQAEFGLDGARRELTGLHHSFEKAQTLGLTQLTGQLDKQGQAAGRQVSQLATATRNLTSLTRTLQSGVLTVGRGLAPRQLKILFQAGRAFTALVTGRYGRAIIQGLNLVRVIGQEIVRAGLSYGR